MQEDGASPGMTELKTLSNDVARADETAALRQPHGRLSRSPARLLGLVLAATAACVALTGCGAFQEQYQKGYIMPEGALEQIPIGASQDQVLIVLGTPSTVATLNGEVFYYISQRAERKIAFMNQQIVDQRVIAVYFDKNRHVTRLANYGLKDGKIFDFISRTTPTSGQEMSYLTPLFKLLSFH
ncbi:outer membrane protein assembly factor BamE [Bradyrhizobium sp. 2TAF24]|uniref:outer membrane protein assembly factor BamE n=1 Tax=Bradyrhizobium sp. 2TAF24 TaxID=3233011 RepID=UPI003F8EDCB5